MKIIQKRVLTIGIFVLLLQSFLIYVTPLYADTMPDKQTLSAQITSQATAQTSSIHADTSTAPTTSTTVTNTGNNTSTSTTSQSSSQTTVSNQNTATVNQTTNATANTGNNDASRNISIGGDAGIISTGNATVNSTSVTQANTNNTAIGGSSGSGGSSLNETNTGNNVTSSTNSNSTSTTLVNNGNATTINQTTNATANTGGNTAARNISIGGSSGVITTGNASTNVNTLVTANGSVTLIGGAGNGHGPGSGASIVLANAGDAARFTSLTNTNSFLVVTNDNRSMISQTCGAPLDPNQLLVSASSCTANTGGNDASRNIAHGGDAGVIHTGNAVLNVVFLTNTNTNTTQIAYTNPSGGSSLDAVNTGNNTDATLSTNNSQSTTVNNNNSATINQTANALANTGHNRADRNISFGGNAGVITTGNATVNVLMGASANNNRTGIIPSSSGGLTIDPSASILNTGDGANFFLQSDNTHTTVVNNNNLLTLAQTFLTYVNTGLNKAVRSIGEAAGLITTGDALAATGAYVTANSNRIFVTGSPQDPTLLSSVPGGTSDQPAPSVTPTVSPSTLTPSATPTPPPVFTGTTYTSTGGTTNMYYNYYYSYNYPNYQYPFVTGGSRNYFLNRGRFGGNGIILASTQPTLQTGGQVLGVQGGISNPAPMSPVNKITWFILFVLSSIVGFGVYIGRHTLFDPRLYT